MIDLLAQSHCPTLDELSDFIRNPVFDRFCEDLTTGLRAKHAFAFSRCSWIPGWNLKFRTAGRNLCTVYPKEGFFTVLVVIGPRERETAEAILPTCSGRLQRLYRETEEGNGQRWLMIDLEDADEVYHEALRLIKIRSGKNFEKNENNG